jgi:hypothetical protein
MRRRPENLTADQLLCDANFPRRLAHRPLKDIADAKPTADFLDIDGSALESETRIASDHEQRFKPRKPYGDLLNHSVRKILLRGIAAHVGQRCGMPVGPFNSESSSTSPAGNPFGGQYEKELRIAPTCSNVETLQASLSEFGDGKYTNGAPGCS